MKKHQLCCIGHITLDKVVTPQSTVYMPGGTAFYCSHAIRHFNDIDYTLVTAVGATEMNVVKQLRKVGIDVTALPSRHSVYFENIYGTNPDDRTQRVLAKADPFTASQLREIDAEIYHIFQPSAHEGRPAVDKTDPQATAEHAQRSVTRHARKDFLLRRAGHQINGKDRRTHGTKADCPGVAQ